MPVMKGEITSITVRAFVGEKPLPHLQIAVRFDPTPEFPSGAASINLRTEGRGFKLFCDLFQRWLAPLGKIVLNDGDVLPLHYPIPVVFRIVKEAVPDGAGTVERITFVRPFIGEVDAQ